MNTATQTAPTAAPADRFRCESDVPDPPRDPAGRKQYWEDTVAEAVAELRRRLASTRDEKSFQALQMILDLEKTRLRHSAPVAGTEVSGGYSSPLPPMEQCIPGGRYEGPKNAEAKTGPHPVAAQPPSPCDPEPVAQAGEGSVLPPLSPVPAERGTSEGEGPGVRADVQGEGDQKPPLPSYPFPPKPLRPIPLRERLTLQSLHKGVIGHFHDHDDDYLLERGRGRRTRDTSAEADTVEPVLALILPPPLPRPAVKNFDLFSVS